jgi:hypothetical protein
MATNQRGTDSSTSRSDVGRTDDLDRDRTTNPDAHPDPITGAPGSHPVGTGVGAAVGGAAGMVAGSAIPGIGTVVGGVVGAIVGGAGGGLAGKDIAENVNPTTEDAYWRDTYKTRPYYSSDATYDDDYAPAYRYGWESRSRYTGRKFDDVESDLASGWEKAKAKSRLGWEKAKAATRDAWDRVDNAVTSDDRRDVR